MAEEDKREEEGRLGKATGRQEAMLG